MFPVLNISFREAVPLDSLNRDHPVTPSDIDHIQPLTIFHQRKVWGKVIATEYNVCWIQPFNVCWINRGVYMLNTSWSLYNSKRRQLVDWKGKVFAQKWVIVIAGNYGNVFQCQDPWHHKVTLKAEGIRQWLLSCFEERPKILCLICRGDQYPHKNDYIIYHLKSW